MADVKFIKNEFIKSFGITDDQCISYNRRACRSVLITNIRRSGIYYKDLERVQRFKDVICSGRQYIDISTDFVNIYSLSYAEEIKIKTYLNKILDILSKDDNTNHPIEPSPLYMTHSLERYVSEIAIYQIPYSAWSEPISYDA